MIRLDKFLCDAGVGTRSEVKKILKKEFVYINGERENNPNRKLHEEDEVIFRGESLSTQEFLYYLFHKPQGCVCANTDHVHKTVFHYVPMNRKGDLATVGRLDLDTEGLLLITNDGQFHHIMVSPKKEIPKTYVARVRGYMTEEDVQAFASGLDIGDEKPAKPAVLKILEAGQESLCEITVTEGRFHEVKRLCLACGKEVLYLKRLSMGEFELPSDLPCGSYRELNEREMKYVKEYKSSIV